MAKVKDWWGRRSEEEQGCIIFVIFLFLGIVLLWGANWASLHQGSDVWVVFDAGIGCLIISGLAGLSTLYFLLKNKNII